jgi:hypothetical protein
VCEVLTEVWGQGRVHKHQPVHAPHSLT